MKKVLVLTLAFVLVAAMSVGLTLAYLTSSDSVENTFTTGNVAITLDEADVDEYGEEVAGAPRVEGNEYKLIPGHLYVKDPKVHVDAQSENCWIFVKVDNGLGQAEITIPGQMEAKGWTLVDEANGIYAYESIVEKGDTIPVFDTFTFAGNADPAQYENAKIIVTAYAVQADGFDTAADAWENAPTDWK